MRNAPIKNDQIQTMTHKQTGEKWIKIKNIDRSMRATVQSIVMDAGIHAITPSGHDLRRMDWAILFAASEADKLVY